ncbi:putative gtr1/RagA G protein conserved region [Lyophyllum shimeji]|uniref:GTP-binding protein n=1 Tax=Lyophyllum shimeji TaxID=47721 RepID=A0A9P3PPN6_LYOSH|nr:putative gtr1/RagA G protein conserved region [Lyophyllum shimeji]
MVNGPPSYAATSTTLPRTQRPPLNGHKSLSGDGVTRTKILLLGLRRAGKTSIQQVLFNNLPPKQTFYLETTMRIVKHTFDTVIPLEIWDCPGNITVETLGAPLSQFATMIFVIDIRDLYNQPISKLVEFIVAAYQANPDMSLEVFVHKAEKLQEDDKIENFRQIHERVSDRLLDIAPEYEQVQLNFHLTSVYDHSLHEAFSKVLHKLVDSLPYLEDLLNVFCANSQSPKAFLFDTTSRLYIATDASPVDSATFNLCCDYLQMLNSFGTLYKSAAADARRPLPTTPPPSASSTSSPSRGPTASDPGTPTGTEGTSTPNATTLRPSRDLFYPSASTSLHPSTPGTTLTYHLITPQLALLALLPTSVYEGRRGLIEFNVVFFREGVQEISQVEKEARTGG